MKEGGKFRRPSKSRLLLEKCKPVCPASVSALDNSACKVMPPMISLLVAIASLKRSAAIHDCTVRSGRSMWEVGITCC